MFELDRRRRRPERRRRRRGPGSCPSGATDPPFLRGAGQLAVDPVRPRPDPALPPASEPGAGSGMPAGLLDLSDAAVDHRSVRRRRSRTRPAGRWRPSISTASSGTCARPGASCRPTRGRTVIDAGRSGRPGWRCCGPGRRPGLRRAGRRGERSGRADDGRHRVRRGGPRPRLPGGHPPRKRARGGRCANATPRTGSTVCRSGRPARSRGGYREGGHVKAVRGDRDADGGLHADEVVLRWNGWSLALPTAQPARRHRRPEPYGGSVALPVRRGLRGPGGPAARAALRRPLPDARPRSPTSPAAGLELRGEIRRRRHAATDA